MQPAPPASPASTPASTPARLRRSSAMRPVPTLLSAALALSALAVAGAAPAAQSEVRVRFSSPQLSYEHGSRSHGALSAPPPPLPPPPPPPPAPAPLPETHVRRGRLVQFVLAPDESQLPTAVAAITLQAATAPSAVDADEALLALPVAPAVLARVLASPLFFGGFPHADALLRYQRGREAAGLAADRLGSARPESPFYRWPNMRARRRSGGRRGARARNPLWYY